MAAKTRFIAQVIVEVDGEDTTKKQIRAYVQDALDRYDRGWHGNDIPLIRAMVRRDVDIQ